MLAPDLTWLFAEPTQAFPDVDAPFGSVGSFFALTPTYGSFEVNPPFVPSIMDATAKVRRVSTCNE